VRRLTVIKTGLVVKNTGLQGDGNSWALPKIICDTAHRHGLEVVLNQIQKTRI
jgi:hypothetical protein